MMKRKRSKLVGLGERVSEEHVAQVLQLIAARPNEREVRRPTDPEGNYDYWFDGGACKSYTGGQVFFLEDGTQVEVAVPIPALSLTIRFADGRVVSIQQEPW